MLGIICLFPLWLSLVMIVRLLKPWIWIRFGALRNENYGHFIVCTFSYYSDKENNLEPPEAIDCFYLGIQKKVANQYVLEQWRRILRINELFFYLDKVNKLLPNWESHHIQNKQPEPFNAERCFSQTSIPFKFTESELEYAIKEMRCMGIDKKAKIVCFAGRSKNYFMKKYIKKSNFCDYRTVSTKLFVETIKYLVEQGYTCIRMGRDEPNDFEWEHPNVIDFSRKYYSEFMEVYLSSIAKFCVMAEGGVRVLSGYIFRKPTVVINCNWMNLNTWDKNAILIPLHMKDNRTNEYVSVADLTQYNLKDYEIEECQQRGHTLIKNSSQDVLAAVKEMEQKINNNHKKTNKQKQFETQVWPIMKKHSKEYKGVKNHRGNCEALISANFVEKYDCFNLQK